MTEPVISVAVITYNQETLLGEALDSILSQEHAYSYEIVVGDDCSSDNTPRVIEDYWVKYPDIIKPIFNKRNLGITGNYYNVIRHCRGKYIMQCAGDDYWLPGKVSLQLPYMEAHPDIGMCYTEAKNHFNRKRLLDRNSWGGSAVSFTELLKRNVVPAVTMSFRADNLKQFMAEVQPESLSWPIEDYPEVLWFSLKSKIGFIEVCTAVYRVVKESAVHNRNFEKIEPFFLATRDIKRFFIEMHNSLAYNDAIQMADDELNRSYFSYFLYIDRKLALDYYYKIVAPSSVDKIKSLICRFDILHKLFQYMKKYTRN